MGISSVRGRGAVDYFGLEWWLHVGFFVGLLYTHSSLNTPKTERSTELINQLPVLS
jgi:hypothetical protein